MKVSIVTNMVPFVYGGGEIHVNSLVRKLEEYGHQPELIRLPFAWDTPSKIAESMLAVRLANLVNTDKVIAMKFPAYYIEHPDKTVWLIHQFRQAYDLAGTEYDFFTDSFEHQKVKRAIIQADNRFFGSMPGRIYTNSHITTERLRHFNGIDSSVLYPPLDNAEDFYCGEYGDYFFYPSRVNNSKRQQLAVEAMRYVKSSVKLILAGKGDTKEDEEQVLALIEKYALSDKVKYYNRFISEQEKIDLYADALGILFIPYNEEFGYITLEAFHSHKPMITCHDSGGPVYFVERSEAGYVTAPEPQALAEKMDALYAKKSKAKEMGEAGYRLIDTLGINWENVIGSLLK
ncbi:MAG: glycosyltransferase family 4 protein [Christensenellaceae bacterium]